ncbi:MAG: peptidoglycan D,D-transpeptidase FtsI family protein [Thermincolia bacterium]
MENNIRRLAYGLISLFLILILYLTYLQVFKGNWLVGHQQNKRLLAYEAEIARGTIYDRQGRVLAETKAVDGKLKRRYPMGELFAHLIGYTSVKYGKTGLEQNYDRLLMGLNDEQKLDNFVNRLQGQPQVGNDLVLTVDSQLQGLGRALLGNRRGAVVALDPRSGEVLALITNPSFNPNLITETWPQISADSEKGFLVNRATQGVYPPGSIMKVVTGAGVLTEDPMLGQVTYNCPGYLEIGDYKLNDLAVHGQVGFNKAMAVSCNTTFGQLGIKLGSQNFYDNALAFGFLEEIPFDLPIKTSSLPEPDKLTKAGLAQSAIGQGELVVTPLHMALVAAGIANDGVMMRPKLVAQVRSGDGSILSSPSNKKWKQAVSTQVARTVKNAMVQVVAEGTGRSAQLSGVAVAGKTGSAQNPHGDSHAWFIGFAPAEQPRVAVAVIVENVGYGGREAAPIAQQIMGKAIEITR